MRTVTLLIVDWFANERREREWSIPVSRIVAVEHCPEALYSDGKRLSPKRMVVYLDGLIVGEEHVSSSSRELVVEDLPSMAALTNALNEKEQP